MKKIKTIKQIKNLKGKKVLVRCDFNVPIIKGKVVDNYKILKSLPTIKYLLQKKANIILVTHLGRPKGLVDKKLSVQPIVNELGKMLDEKIKLYQLSQIKALAKHNFSQDSIVMIENSRFSPDENHNSGSFAKDLSRVADIFVLDGFAVSHRSAATVLGVGKLLPAYAGLLMEKEIKGLSKLVVRPKKPFVVVLGGIKMETKIPVIKNLLSKASHILVGGGIVNTYLFAKGYFVGDSLVDKNLRKIVLKYCKNRKVIVPLDLVIGTKNGKEHKVIKIDMDFNIKKDWAIFDIGPETVRLYAKYIKKAQTVAWNGAMGYFEQHPYQYGTHSIAQLVASRSKGKAFGVCGGGETIEVLKKLKIFDDVDLVSTGGGSMLEFLAGKKLPGVEVVTKK